MKKIKFLAYSIANINLINMFKTVKQISNKINKPYIIVLIDVIWCGFKYQAGYHDYLEFEFYNLNNEERKTYITRGINNEIIKRFNDKSKWHYFSNKALFHENFYDFTKREFLCLHNNIKEFEMFLRKHQQVIAKPIEGEGGEGVEMIIYKSISDINKIYNKLVENNQLLIEEYIKQHKGMNELYSTSVNSLRMFTFIKDNNPHFLQAALKIGNGSIIDNFAGGGMYTILNDEGKVIYSAIDKNDNIYNVHPVTNKQIIGFQVPLFDEAVELVCEAAKIIPEVGYIGWDVAISENGPVIIEGNCYPGVFQTKPSLKEDKTGSLLKYNEVMKLH